jgi:tRNA (cmo5U34)-methyltransferase
MLRWRQRSSPRFRSTPRLPSKSRIYDGLSPGGVFYNADVVLASNERLQDTYMRQWRDFMRRSMSEQEIEDKWIPKYHAEDHPAKLIDQLKWLAEIGFDDVDVLWKQYNFAVYGGAKGTREGKNDPT